VVEGNEIPGICPKLRREKEETPKRMGGLTSDPGDQCSFARACRASTYMPLSVSEIFSNAAKRPDRL